MGVYAARCMALAMSPDKISGEEAKEFEFASAFAFELFTHVTRFFGHKVWLYFIIYSALRSDCRDLLVHFRSFLLEISTDKDSEVMFWLRRPTSLPRQVTPRWHSLSLFHLTIMRRYCSFIRANVDVR